MISSTLGAPLGGTTRGAHHGFDSAAFSLITPPNFGSGGGSCFPSMVVVALGEPGVPVICWALTVGPTSKNIRQAVAKLRIPRSLGSSFGAFMWFVVGSFGLIGGHQRTETPDRSKLTRGSPKRGNGLSVVNRWWRGGLSFLCR